MSAQCSDGKVICDGIGMDTFTMTVVAESIEPCHLSSDLLL